MQVPSVLGHLADVAIGEAFQFTSDLSSLWLKCDVTQIANPGTNAAVVNLGTGIVSYFDPAQVVARFPWKVVPA